MAVACDDVLVGGHLTQAHRTTGVHLLGGNAQLAAQTELASVCESGRGIDIDGCRVHMECEKVSRLAVFRHNGLAVPCRVLGDVADSLFYT